MAPTPSTVRADLREDPGSRAFSGVQADPPSFPPLSEADEMPRVTAGSSHPLDQAAAARANGDNDPLEDGSWVLANEDALLSAVDKARKTIIWTPFSIPRIQIDTPEGPRPLTFTIRGLNREELEKCERDAQVPTGRRAPGGGKETKRNSARYERLVVIAATKPEDAARLWRSARMREKLNVAEDVDVVRYTLLPGEIAQVGMEIAALSGFLPDEQEIAKSPPERWG